MSISRLFAQQISLAVFRLHMRLTLSLKWLEEARRRVVKRKVGEMEDNKSILNHSSVGLLREQILFVMIAHFYERSVRNADASIKLSAFSFERKVRML